MASSEGNYHRRGPYFDGTNFASCVGERSRILKFSTHHQDQSMESSSNERERGVHLHTLVDRERKRSSERG